MIIYNVDKKNRKVSARFVCFSDFNKWGKQKWYGR